MISVFGKNFIRFARRAENQGTRGHSATGGGEEKVTRPEIGFRHEQSTEGTFHPRATIGEIRKYSPSTEQSFFEVELEVESKGISCRARFCQTNLIIRSQSHRDYLVNPSAKEGQFCVIKSIR